MPTRRPSDQYYVTPVAGDFRQGDIYRECLHLAYTTPQREALRRFDRAGRCSYVIHGENNPPQGGFHWDSKEVVAADGQIAFGIVLTHDCEIENDDRRTHRLMAMLRPLAALSEDDRDIIRSDGHYGRLWLPASEEVGLDEMYVDFRRITTVRLQGLPPDENRIASLTDFGREVLQYAMIRYLTAMYRGE